MQPHEFRRANMRRLELYDETKKRDLTPEEIAEFYDLQISCSAHLKRPEGTIITASGRRMRRGLPEDGNAE